MMWMDGNKNLLIFQMSKQCVQKRVFDVFDVFVGKFEHHRRDAVMLHDMKKVKVGHLLRTPVELASLTFNQL